MTSMAASDPIPEKPEDWIPYLKVVARSLIDRRWRSRLSESDLVQQTMIDVMKDREKSGMPPEKRSAWLFQILKHNILDAAKAQLADCRDVRREQSLERTLDSSVSLLRNQLSAERDDATDGDDRVQKLLLLTAEIERMPEKERTVLTLRYLDGIETEAIAKQMGFSVQSTTLLIARTVRELKRRLDKRS